MSKPMQFVRDDGGRAAAGYKGSTGDCVVRAVAIAAEIPYAIVYAALSNGQQTQRKTKRSGKSRSVRDGVSTNRKWFKDYMASIGWTWTPTMHIGSGCKVHLVKGELPMGRLIVRVSRHLCAVLDGVIHDTDDPQRHIDVMGAYDAATRRNIIVSSYDRCVYGYWSKS